ncbi:MAG: helix-turn-helix domain-containing protein [Bacteroidota bacterium]
MNIAEHILSARRAKGWSQEELSQRSGLSLRTIQRVERGEGQPRLHSLRVLAATLALDLATLTGEQTVSDTPTATEWQHVWRMLLVATLAAIIPLLNVVLPLVMQKRLSLGGTALGLSQRVISWQLIWTILLLLAFGVAPFVSLHLTGQVNVGRLPLFLLVYGVALLVQWGTAIILLRWISQQAQAKLLRLPNLFGL